MPDAPTKPAWPATFVTGGLMAAAVGLQIASMFPLYPANPAAPIAQTTYELAAYICLETGWALAAALVLSRWLPRAGVALGAGLGTVQVGLVAADLASGFQLGEGGEPGIWLALAGLAAGLAGVLYGAGTPSVGLSTLSLTPAALQVPASSQGVPARPSTAEPVRVLLSVLAAVVAVGAFWPSWDHYHVVSLTGQVRSLNLGNAFDQPAAVMAGELVAGLAIGFTAILGALWRDALVGAFATVGAVMALASQVISGGVQVSEPLSQLLGTPATSGVNLAASSVTLTAYWYVDAAATAALGLLALWQLAGAHKVQRRLSSTPGAAWHAD
jgi:hypothetical protein